jgi:hypothetical protein|tara:strand:+ start:6724 stop:7848 length:1125 start_codon:yes stop_codon:yes gene_type:complete
MSHLAEEYAKSCGVKIGKPILKPHFFPIPFDKYITIHNDKKIQAKEYNFWPEVIELLKPHLGDIKILQVGSFGEETIEGVDKHIPTFSLKQCTYIIKKALGHVGIDSVPVHIASSLDKPVVGIYSHTYANTCSPLWNEKNKAITIESDRGGKKPSFALEENPKTINLIKPEKIAQAVLDVLEINKNIKQETIYMGPRSIFNCIEVIPSKITNFQGGPVSVRMDLAHNEDVLNHIIQFTPVEVTTKKPIDVGILMSKRIQRLSYEAKSFDEKFVELLKKTGIETTLVCTDEKNITKERARFFDYMIHQDKKPQVIKDNKKLLGDVNLNSLKIKSRKRIICGDKIYDSHFEKNERKNEDDLFVDLDWFVIYNTVDD